MTPSTRSANNADLAQGPGTDGLPPPRNDPVCILADGRGTDGEATGWMGRVGIQVLADVVRAQKPEMNGGEK